MGDKRDSGIGNLMEANWDGEQHEWHHILLESLLYTDYLQDQCRLHPAAGFTVGTPASSPSQTMF